MSLHSTTKRLSGLQRDLKICGRAVTERKQTTLADAAADRAKIVAWLRARRDRAKRERRYDAAIELTEVAASIEAGEHEETRGE